MCWLLLLLREEFHGYLFVHVLEVVIGSNQRSGFLSRQGGRKGVGVGKAEFTAEPAGVFRSAPIGLHYVDGKNAELCREGFGLRRPFCPMDYVINFAPIDGRHGKAGSTVLCLID